jgi:hypothetical protein
MPGTLPALPPSLMRRYQVYIHPARTQEMVPLRKICAQHVGQLVRVRVSGAHSCSLHQCHVCSCVQRVCRGRGVCEVCVSERPGRGYPASCRTGVHAGHSAQLCCTCLSRPHAQRCQPLACCGPHALTTHVLHVLQGIVTQITDVKPLATVVSYIDEDTNREVFQEVGGCPPD